MLLNKYGVINGDSSNKHRKKGTTGTEISFGTIRSDDQSTEWSSRKKYDNIDKMRRTDAMVNAILTAHELLLLQATQIIEPASNDMEDLKIAYDTENFLFHNPRFDWEYIHRHILKNWQYGFYLFFKEPWRDKRDGRDLLSFDLQPRKPETIERWIEDDDGNLREIQQNAQVPNGGYQWMSMQNKDCVLFNTGREGNNYEGESLFRPVWRNFKLKDMLMRLDGIAHERWAVPTPILRMPELEQDDDDNDAANVLENHRVHEKGYFIVPNGFELDFLTTKSGDGTDIWKSIEGNNKEMTSAFLANFILVGMTEAGTYNLVENKQDLFMRSIQGHGNAIENTINDRFEARALIRDFVDANYNNVKEYPKFKYAKVADIDITKLAESLLKFSQIGLPFNDSETESFIRKNAGLPETAQKSISQKTIPRITTEKEKGIQQAKTNKERQDLTDCNCYIELKEDDLPFKLNREMTDFEREICCVDKLATQLEKYRNNTVLIGNQFRKQMISKLIARSKAMLSRKMTITEFMNEVDKSANMNATGKGLFQKDFINALTKELRAVWKFGRNTIKDEVKKQTKKLQDDPETSEEVIIQEGTKTIRPEAAIAVSTLVTKLVNEWKGEMVRQKKQGIVNTVAIRKVLEDLTKNDFKRQMTNRVANTFGEGRTFQTSKFKDNGVEMTIVRSEILDTSTCANCAAIDGQEYKSGDSDYQLVASGQYELCESNHGTMGNQCRGINILQVE